MSEPEAGKWISDQDQAAVNLGAAVRAGDVAAVQGMLRDDPALATARLGTRERGSGTPLHLVTDWPGYFPNGPQIARLLVNRGARVDKAWHAAALGMLARLDAVLGSDPSAEQVSQAFWRACAAGQRRAAEYLLARGADLNWEPDYAHGTPLDSATGLGTRQENVISWLRELGARSAGSG